MPTWPPTLHQHVRERIESVTRPPGLLAARGLASDYPGGTYLSTDLNGGTEHQSDGAAWVQAGPGAAQVAGTRIAAASMTSGYSTFSQGSPTTYTDVSLQVAIGLVQTLSYDVELDVVGIVTGGATWAAGNVVQLQVRVVDSAVTVLGVGCILKFRGEGVASQSPTDFQRIRFNVPAGYAATTWKVQARQLAASPTGVTEIALYAGPALSTPVAGFAPSPIYLSAITVA